MNGKLFFFLGFVNSFFFFFAFQNFVTLVTGASSGIGKATALHFAGKGARVVLCDSSEAAGAAVAKTIGDNALFVPTDISSEKSVQALLEQIEKKFGKLNVIVNCQSLSSPFACRTYDFEAKKSHSLEEFQKIFVVSVYELIINRSSNNSNFCFVADKCIWCIQCGASWCRFNWKK